MKKEASIILPCNEGSEDVHAMLARGLARRFGGYTKTIGMGGWISPDGVLVQEPVAIYVVAVPVNAFPMNATWELRDMLTMAGRALDQTCVYMRDTQGEVHIIDL